MVHMVEGGEPILLKAINVKEAETSDIDRQLGGSEVGDPYASQFDMVDGGSEVGIRTNRTK